MNALGAAAGWDCHVHVFAAGAAAHAGHYAPQDHPIERIESLAAQHGFGHLVLVQPSVYGANNGLLLDALQASAGRHRGVVVVDDLVPDDELERWHALGVRGIRCNLVSPVGNHQPNWAVWTPRLKALGWHVQWYAHAQQLPQVLQWQQRWKLPCVLDHVAGMHAHLAHDAAAWQSLRALATCGAWIKLSGWYRLGLAAPYSLEQLRLHEIMAMFGHRLVWGSDWPHTSFACDVAPAYDQLWQPLLQLLGKENVPDLARESERLYGA